jgi:hypothetical protein
MKKNNYKKEKNYEEDYIHLNESNLFYSINFSKWCWRCRDYFLGGCIFMACGFIRRDVCKECRNKIENYES